jgi:hypothetical protein
MHRLSGFSSPHLENIDWIGYSREVTIIVTFILFVSFRWRKYANVLHFWMNFLFYAKVCVAAMYYIAHPPYFFGYSL